MPKLRETVAKVTGAAKKAAAIMKGNTGILATLEEEHGEVSTLMKEVQGAGDQGFETRRELYPKIKSELLSHTHAEQETFYVELQRYAKTQPLAAHAVEEHKEIERCVASIDGLAPTDPLWGIRFAELVRTVTEHVHEEEGEVFEHAKEVVPKQRLEQLDDEFRMKKEAERDRIAASIIS